MTGNQIKIAYFNCTGAQSHIGCLAVTNSHFRSLTANGYDIAHVFTTRETSKLRGQNREETARIIANSDIPKKIAECDALVINGEGTIHHQRGGDLLCIAELAKKESKKVFIVNAVIQEMEGWLDILKNVDDLNVRESKSSQYLKQNRIKHRLVLDSFIDAEFNNEPTQNYEGKIVVTDWHPARDEDVGKAMLQFLDSNKDSVFLPFHHWSFSQESSWKNQIANLSTAKLIITGRHHGVYAALMTGVPFVALPSNTYKIEGIVEYFNSKIPFCDNLPDLEKQAAYALKNPKTFKTLQKKILSGKPLSTFDILYKKLPSKNIPSTTELEEKLKALETVLYNKSVDESLADSFAVSRERLRTKDKLQILRDKNLTVQERLKQQQDKAVEAKKLFTEKSESLKSQIQKYKTKLEEVKKTAKETKYLELAKAAFAAQDYKHSYSYAYKGLEITPLSEVLISLLFKSELMMNMQHIRHDSYTVKFLNNIEKIPDGAEKYAVLSKAYSFGSDYPKAIFYFEELQKIQPLSFSQLQDFGMCLHAIGELNKAAKLYEQILDEYKDSEKKVLVPVLRWLALLYCQEGNFDKALALVKKMQKRLKNEEELWPVYTAYLGKEQLKTAWRNYIFNSEQGEYEQYFKGSIKEFEILLKNKNSNPQKLFIMPSGGIGDEIRHASLYFDLQDLIPEKAKEVVACCDPRLLNLFQASFPTIKFFPTSRKNLQSPQDTKLNVPEKLQKSFNDNSFEMAQKADIVMQCYSIMKFFRNSFKDFEKRKAISLKADQNLRRKWRKKLSELGPNLKVGINKGTHLLAANREINVIRFEHWEEVLKQNGIDFINLSLDHSNREITELNKKLGTNIHHFEDIDLKNDMDDLAALISELDVVITPPNMMTDFAGALGTYTLCIYTTAIYDWRFRGKNRADVWHTNAYGIASDVRGKKEGLMENLVKQLEILKNDKSFKLASV